MNYSSPNCCPHFGRRHHCAISSGFVGSGMDEGSGGCVERIGTQGHLQDEAIYKMPSVASVGYDTFKLYHDIDIDTI